MWETHCDDVVRAALLSYFLIAFALWFATACRGPAEDKTPEPPEKAVVCDLEKARAEMPERERKCNEGDARVRGVGLLSTLGHWIALALLVAVCWADPFWWLAVELLTTLTNAKRRSVHDFLARSVVVRTDAS
jgi:hypothetical protein